MEARQAPAAPLLPYSSEAVYAHASLSAHVGDSVTPSRQEVGGTQGPTSASMLHMKADCLLHIRKSEMCESVCQNSDLDVSRHRRDQLPWPCWSLGMGNRGVPGGSGPGPHWAPGCPVPLA